MRLYDPRAGIVFRKIFSTHKDTCISLLNSLLPLADDEKILTKAKQVAQNLKSIGLSATDIAAATGLSVTEIADL